MGNPCRRSKRCAPRDQRRRMILGTRGTGPVQKAVLQALHELGRATSAELVEAAYGTRAAKGPARYTRMRSVRAALHAIGARAVDRQYPIGGNIWKMK